MDYELYLEYNKSDVIPFTYWNGTTLYATCEYEPGAYPVIPIPINTSLCTQGSRLTNIHGVLICEDGLIPGLPYGPWSRTCSPYSWDGSSLVAYCSNSFGLMRDHRICLGPEDSQWPTSMSDGEIGINNCFGFSHSITMRNKCGSLIRIDRHGNGEACDTNVLLVPW